MYKNIIITRAVCRLILYLCIYRDIKFMYLYYMCMSVPIYYSLMKSRSTHTTRTDRCAIFIITNYAIRIMYTCICIFSVIITNILRDWRSYIPVPRRSALSITRRDREYILYNSIFLFVHSPFLKHCRYLLKSWRAYRYLITARKQPAAVGTSVCGRWCSRIRTEHIWYIQYCSIFHPQVSDLKPRWPTNFWNTFERPIEQ